MNYSTLALLASDKVKTVGVKFYCSGSVELGQETYTYKTTHDFQVNDHAVVFVGQKPKVVKVVELDTLTNDTIEYKWIVCRVDEETYSYNLKLEKQIVKKVRKIEEDHKRKQILDALGITDELKTMEFKS